MGVGGALLAVGAVGAGISAYSTIQQGNYSAQVAKNNAQIANQSATYSTEAGNQAGENQSLKNSAQMGELKASQAANNVNINSGSALGVQEGQAAAGQLDTQTTVHNALLQAYGYQTQAESDTAQAGQDSASGDIGAAGGLLSSASSLGFKWSGMSGVSDPGVGDSMGNDGTDDSIVTHQGGTVT